MNGENHKFLLKLVFRLCPQTPGCALALFKSYLTSKPLLGATSVLQGKTGSLGWGLVMVEFRKFQQMTLPRRRTPLRGEELRLHRALSGRETEREGPENVQGDPLGTKH